MKSLMIGQVSKEYGASETTGAALVAMELAKCSGPYYKIALYATNISNKDAQKIKDFKAFGYSRNIMVYFLSFLSHPIKSIRHIIYYKRQMGVNPLRYFFYEVNIGNAIRQFNPTIIQTHGLSQYMPTFFFFFFDVPLVVTMHGYWYTDEKHERILRTSMPFVENITTLTPMAKRDILHDFPRGFKHFDIIANGADTLKFYFSAERRAEIRKQLAIDDNTIVFITVASIQERKGQLRFMEYLHGSRMTNYCYLIIGKGREEYENKLRQFISDNGLEKNVILLGYVKNEEAYAYYSAADIYAHVSTSEGQSLSEMEAASTGLRIIVNESLVETLPEIVTETNDTYYILNMENKNYESLEKWVKRVQVNRHSVEYYSWSKVVERYYKAFMNIIETDKKRLC